MERQAENLFNVGDMVLFGKYKNKRGKITDIGIDDRGVPYVTIEPIPKGRKAPKTIGLFNVWREDHLKYAPHRVAARYLEAQGSRVSAVVDGARLEQWKKDLRVMTKIYRDIPLDFAWDDKEGKAKAESQFTEARALFKTFRKGFTDWVYEVVLPRKDQSDQTYAEKSLAKSAWDFQYTLTLLFPTYRGETPDLDALKRERERNVKRYQVAATKAFKDLEAYLESQGGGALQRYDQEDTLEVGGVRVVIKNHGRDADHEADLHKTLNLLKRWIAGIERAGFPTAVRGLIITVNFGAKEFLTNGTYNPQTDTLTLTPLGMVGTDTIRTVTHEVGHRFYFRDLPAQARSHWESVIESKGIKVTEDAIRRFADAVTDKVDPGNPGSMMSASKVLQATLPAARNQSDELVFKELSRLPIMRWSDNTFDPARYLDFLMGSKGETVLVEEITEYGRTNPVEAFAECFQMWILKGPRALGPWTQEFFRTICRAGGAKIASTEHYRVECPTCGTVLRQCRCLGHNQVVTYEVCPACQGK